MSKPRPVTKQIPQTIPTKIVEPENLMVGLASAEPDTAIPWFRRCPLCWERCKGVGTAYSTQGSTRFYKCTRTLTELPPCAHTWTAQVKTEVVSIAHRVVTLDGQR